MRYHYLQESLKDSNDWRNNIDRLIIDLRSDPGKYTFYLQENQDLLKEQKEAIATYQQALHDNLDNRAHDTIESIRITHQEVKAKYQHLQTLSDDAFQLKRVFPLKADDWQLQQSDQHFKIFSGTEQGSTVAKIEIGTDNNRLATLQQALAYTYQSTKGIDYLDLRDNQLDDTAMQLLANALNNHPGYQHAIGRCEALILSNNNVTERGLEILLNAFADWPLKRHVLLDKNRVDFDPIFLDRVVIPKTKQANFINLDLTMNFIPKGYMFKEDNIRIYYRKSRMKTKLSAQGIPLEQRTHIKSYLFCHNNTVRSLLARHSDAVISLIAAQDIHNYETEIDHTSGVIGLFANRTTFPLIGEHAYLMVEGVSKFGQRYLIRGDLYTPDGQVVRIRVSQCSPQDFLKFTNDGIKIYCRTGTFCREKIKNLVDKLCESHCVQSFHNYSIYPNQKGQFNCITWAIALIEKTTDVCLEGWKPTTVVQRSNKGICHIS